MALGSIVGHHRCHALRPCFRSQLPEVLLSYGELGRRLCYVDLIHIALPSSYSYVQMEFKI
jgi:hypothetical protein